MTKAITPVVVNNDDEEEHHHHHHHSISFSSTSTESFKDDVEQGKYNDDHDDHDDDDDKNIPSRKTTTTTTTTKIVAKGRDKFSNNKYGESMSSFDTDFQGQDSFDKSLSLSDMGLFSSDDDDDNNDDKVIIEMEDGMGKGLGEDDDDDNNNINTNNEHMLSKSKNEVILPNKRLRNVKFWRTILILASILCASTNGVLAYLYITEVITIPNNIDDSWFVPLVLVTNHILLAIITFFYDIANRRCIEKLEKTAKKNATLVNELFPANIRKRILKEQSKQAKVEKQMERSQSTIRSRRHRRLSRGSRDGSERSGIMSIGSFGSHTRRQKRRGRKSFVRSNTHTNSASASPSNETATTVVTAESSLDDPSDELIPKDILTNKPIADFYPHCTILFADIVGFTAWSSVREASAVFTLLESLYASFDRFAKKLGVFKVETIGDCYVAATGLPQPMEQHAEIMAKFSSLCMDRMKQIVEALEKHLGPDTGDLSMRFGLHSGPVTAGCMRGDRARYQIFGDTVNTAARIESTGSRDKVHLSSETAQLLVRQGKSAWVERRDARVQAKGKGEMQTYWLVLPEVSGNQTPKQTQEVVGLKSGSSHRVDSTGGIATSKQPPSSGVHSIVAMFEKKGSSGNDKKRRQASYVIQSLREVMKKIAMRSRGSLIATEMTPMEAKSFASMEGNLPFKQTSSYRPINDTKEAIDFIHLCNQHSTTVQTSAILPTPIVDLLEDFLINIFSLYGENNGFNTVERVSHEIVSLRKLYSRLHSKEIFSAIQKDPHTELGLLFAIIFHGVGQCDMTNSELVKTNHKIVQTYGDKFPKEQNAICMAWDVFHRAKYQKLRRYLYSTEEEMMRFHQLVVTLVLTTDVDHYNNTQQNARNWNRIFSKKNISSTQPTMLNQQAILALQSIIQLSRLGHYAQHWQIFVKWNKLQFLEMNGRSEKKRRPEDFWFDEQLKRFDDVVIPLFSRGNESGIFGRDMEELLSYAKSNRMKWQSTGRETIQSYISELSLPGNTKHSAISQTSASSSMWSSDGSIAFKPPSAYKLSKVGRSTGMLLPPKEAK